VNGWEKMLRRVDVRTCLQLCDSHAILLNFLIVFLFIKKQGGHHVLTQRRKKQKIKNVADILSIFYFY
jgi:hypothetical protein